jgi:hypothetical protein
MKGVAGVDQLEKSFDVGRGGRQIGAFRSLSSNDLALAAGGKRGGTGLRGGEDLWEKFSACENSRNEKNGSGDVSWVDLHGAMGLGVKRSLSQLRHLKV